MADKSRTAAILQMRCPRCRQGSMFYTKNPFSWFRLSEMRHECGACGQKFDLEPGFYWGAMYVSYALSVGIIVPAGFFFAYGIGWSDFVSLIAATLLLVILLPAIYRYSRVVWLYFFVRYRPGER